jgi:hypothetical protein
MTTEDTMTTTTTRTLIDDETGTDLGAATPAQIAASERADAKGQNGLIWIDADGDPIPEGGWGYGAPGGRRVWVL